MAGCVEGDGCEQQEVTQRPLAGGRWGAACRFQHDQRVTKNTIILEQ